MEKPITFNPPIIFNPLNKTKLLNLLNKTIKKNNYTNPTIEICIMINVEEDEKGDNIIDIEHSTISIGIVVNNSIVWICFSPDKYKYEYEDACEYCKKDLYNYLSNYFNIELHDELEELAKELGI